jgi:hypothetical protein
MSSRFPTDFEARIARERKEYELWLIKLAQVFQSKQVNFTAKHYFQLFGATLDIKALFSTTKDEPNLDKAENLLMKYAQEVVNQDKDKETSHVVNS